MEPAALNRFEAGPPVDSHESRSARFRVVDGEADSRIEARYDGTNGRPALSLVREGPRKGRPQPTAGVRKSAPGGRTAGLKKPRKGSSGASDLPPTPWGCEWKRVDDGWNLWRYWSEKEDSTGRRIKKSRYAGTLSHEAWQVMKDYDYETFISVVGQRLRRYGKR